jgi:uncharacterized protein YqjF (DUF2071 family)
LFDLDAAARQARSLDETAHRPWPLPDRPWALGQTWEDMLFAHWRVPVAAIRPLVPSEVAVEQHDGTPWIGVTPFRLTNLRLRGTLPFATFLELNVRTYVRAADGRPGIWFFSLDASSRLAVEAARRLYRLPYHEARISAVRSSGWIDYECARVDEPGRVFSGRYRPAGEPASGELETFLTERYCLYATDPAGRLRRADIHHAPRRLEHAEAEIELTTAAPVELAGAPVLHYSQRLDALVWPLEPVA